MSFNNLSILEKDSFDGGYSSAKEVFLSHGFSIQFQSLMACIQYEDYFYSALARSLDDRSIPLDLILL